MAVTIVSDGNAEMNFGRPGPFIDTSTGYLYCVIYEGLSGGQQNNVWRSTDGGTSWSIVDTDIVSGDLNIWGIEHSAGVHWFGHQSGWSSEANFPFSTENSETFTTIDSGSGNFGGVGRRSDGDLLAAHQGTAEKIKGIYYTRAAWERDEGSGWGNSTILSASTHQSAVAANFVPGPGGMGESDKWHISFANTTTPTAYVTSIDSSNTERSGGAQTLNSSVAPAGVRPPVYYDDGGVERITWVYYRSVSPYIYSREIDDDGTISAQESIPDSGNEPAVGVSQFFVTVDPTNKAVYVAWRESGDSDLYYDVNTDSGGWGTDVTQAITLPATVAMVSGNVFTHSSGNGGDFVLGIVYDDGTDVFYDEYVITAGSTTVQLAGSGASASQGSGSLDVEKAIAGSGPNASQGSGTLERTRPLTGSGASASSGSGTLTTIGTPSFGQVAARAYTDGDETDAVLVSGGNAPTCKVGTLYHFRFEVEETAGTLGTLVGQMERQLNAGAWADVTASSTVLQMLPSWAVDTTGAATTNRLDTSAETFKAHTAVEMVDGAAASITLNNQATNLVFTAFIPAGDVTHADTINVRVRNTDTDGNPTYTQSLAITVAETLSYPGTIPGEAHTAPETHAFFGPIEDSNGNRYVFAETGFKEGASTERANPIMVVWKSEDDGKTWRPVDSTESMGSDGQDLEGISIVRTDPYVTGVVWIGKQSFSNGDLNLWPFYTSDHASTPDTFGTDATLTMASQTAYEDNVVFLERSDGDRFVIEGVAPSTERIGYRWWNGSTWAAIQYADAGTDTYVNPKASSSTAADRTVIAWHDLTNHDILMRAVDAAGTVIGSVQQLNTLGTYNDSSEDYALVDVVCYDDTNDYHLAIWKSADGTLYSTTIKWGGSAYSVGSEQQVSTTTVDGDHPTGADSEGPTVAVAVDEAEGFVYVLYARASDTDLYYNFWSESGGWDTEAALYVSSGNTDTIGYVTAQSMGTVVGYFYDLFDVSTGEADPNLGYGTLEYNEFTAEVGGPVTLAGSGANASNGSGVLERLRPIAGSGPNTSAGSGVLERLRGLTGAGANSSSGSGSLTVKVKVSGSGANASAGTGSLTVGTIVSLSGSGASASQGSGALSVERQLIGSGANASAGSGVLTCQVPISGSGSNTSEGSGALEVLRQLTGSGPNTSEGSGSLTVRVPLAGSGPNVSQGSGTLERTRPLTGSGANASEGSGALTVKVLVTGSGSNASQGAGALDVEKQLIGSGANASAGSGALTVKVLISGSGANASAGSGILTVGTSTLLTGSGPNASAGSGALEVSKALAGSGANASQGSGVLTCEVPLSGSGASASSGAGVLTATVPMSGAGAAASAGTGALSVTRGLSGSGPAASSGTGDLTVTAGTVNLTGSGANASQGSGTLTVRVPLSGSAANTSAGLGSIEVERQLTGSGANASNGSGVLSPTRGLSGSGANTSAGSGVLTVSGAVDLAGSGANSSAGSGSLTVARALSGSGANVSEGSATLSITRGLAGQGPNTSEGSGVLSVFVPLTGAGAAASAGSGALTVLRAMAGAGGSVSFGSGQLIRTRTIGGDGASASDGSGRLNAVLALAGSGPNASNGTGDMSTAQAYFWERVPVAMSRVPVAVTKEPVPVTRIPKDGTPPWR